MTDLIQKILSKLPKNTLVVIVMFMGSWIANYWYKDYKAGQDQIMNSLKESQSEQLQFRIESQHNHKSTTNEIKDLKDQIIKMDGRQDIIIRSMPRIKTQIQEYDMVFQQVVNSRKDESMIEPIPTLPAELYAVTDSVKKKLNEKL
jgi:hypothetical protein